MGLAILAALWSAVVFEDDVVEVKAERWVSRSPLRQRGDAAKLPKTAGRTTSADILNIDFDSKAFTTDFHCKAQPVLPKKRTLYTSSFINAPKAGRLVSLHR